MPLYEHEVVEGDMLSSIAARYGVRVRDVKQLNPNVNPNRLKIGKKIKVCPEIAPRLREEFTYTVKKGDSLSEIGEKYGMTPQGDRGAAEGPAGAQAREGPQRLRIGDELTLIVDRGVLPEFAPRNEDRGTLKVGVQLEPGKGYFIKRPHLAYGTAGVRQGDQVGALALPPEGQGRAAGARRRHQRARRGAAQGPQVAPEGHRRRHRAGAQGGEADETGFGPATRGTSTCRARGR
jgi:hypothetical protein